jgi:hypothetical protein
MAQDKADKTDKSVATTATSATNAPKRYNRGKDGTHPLDKSFKPMPEGVVEELGGDELQKLHVTWSNEISLFAEGDFWRDLEIILVNCDKIMLRHGWNRKAGNRRDFPSDRTAEPFSELWYAGKIGFECWNLLNWHRERGPNEIALAEALYLGRLLAEAEWRTAFKPSILTGRTQRRHLTNLRELQNKSTKNHVAKRREAIGALIKETKLTGGALDKWLARQLADRHSINASTRTIRSDRKAIRG